MKNLFYFTLTVCGLFSSFSTVNAQQGLTNSGSSNTFFQSVDNYFVRDRSAYKLEAEGSPFINEDFETAKFKRFGDRIYQVRFNANLGDIEVKLEDRIIALNKNDDFEVRFLQSNKLYKNYAFTEDGKTSKQFFVVLYDNTEYTILKKEYIKFRAETTSQTGYDKGKPAAWVRENDVYYLKIGESIEEVSTRRKKFADRFPEASKEIKTYLKKEKLDLDNEADLVKAIQYVMNMTNTK